MIRHTAGWPNPKGKPSAYVGDDGDPVGSVNGSGSVECHLYDLVGLPAPIGVIAIGITPEPNPVEGQGYLLICYSTADRTIDLIQFIVYQPGVNIITPGTL